MHKFDNDDAVFKANFAANLKAAFENKKKTLNDKGFTQDNLGEAAGGIKQSTISKYLKGEALPGVLDMCRLALVLDTSVSYLCGFDESENAGNREEIFFSVLSDMIEEKYEKIIDISYTDEAIGAIETDDKEHIWHPEYTDYILNLEGINDEQHPKYDERLHSITWEMKKNPRCKIVISTNSSILSDFIEEYKKVYESYKGFVLNVADDETAKRVYDAAVSDIIKRYSRRWKNANKIQ